MNSKPAGGTPTAQQAGGPFMPTMYNMNNAGSLNSGNHLNQYMENSSKQIDRSHHDMNNLSQTTGNTHERGRNRHAVDDKV